ncbi:MAG TPA: hypothetical protein ENI23_11820, partial [bacterium]|nr:hypothetical protein [bacterium]
MSRRSRDYYRVDKRKRIEIKTKKSIKKQKRSRRRYAVHQEEKLIVDSVGNDYIINNTGLQPIQLKGLELVIDSAMNKQLDDTMGDRPERNYLMDDRGKEKALANYIDDLRNQHPRMKSSLTPLDDFTFSLSEEMRFAIRLFTDARLNDSDEVKHSTMKYIEAITDDMDIARKKHLESLGILLSTDELRKINKELKNLDFDKDDSKSIKKLTKLADRRDTPNLDEEEYGEIFNKFATNSLEFAEIYKSIQLELVKVKENSSAKAEANKLKIALDSMLDDLYVPPIHFQKDSEHNYIQTLVNGDFIGGKAETKFRKLLEQENYLILSPVMADETHRNIMSGTFDESLDLMPDLKGTAGGPPGNRWGDSKINEQLDRRAHRKIIFENGTPEIGGIKSRTGKYIVKIKENTIKPVTSRRDFLRQQAGNNPSIEREMGRLENILDSEGYDGRNVILGILSGKVRIYEPDSNKESVAFAQLNTLREKYIKSLPGTTSTGEFRFKDVGEFDWSRITNSADPRDAIARYFDPFLVYNPSTDEFEHTQDNLKTPSLINYGVQIGLVTEQEERIIVNGKSFDRGKPQSIRRAILTNLNADKVNADQFHKAMEQKGVYWTQGDILKLSLFFGWDYSRGGDEQRAKFLDLHLKGTLDKILKESEIKPPQNLIDELKKETILYDTADGSKATSERFLRIEELEAEIKAYQISTPIKIGTETLPSEVSPTEYAERTLLDFRLSPELAKTYGVLTDEFAKPTEVKGAVREINKNGERAIIQLDRVSQRDLNSDIDRLYKLRTEAQWVEFMNEVGHKYDIKSARDYNNTKPRPKPVEIEKMLQSQATIPLRDPNTIGYRNKLYFATLKAMFISILTGDFKLQDKMKKDALFRRDITIDPKDAGLTTISDPLADDKLLDELFINQPQLGDGMVTPEGRELLIDEAIELEKERQKPVERKPVEQKFIPVEKKPIPIKTMPRRKINHGIKKWRRPGPNRAPVGTIIRLN